VLVGNPATLYGFPEPQPPYNQGDDA